MAGLALSATTPAQVALVASTAKTVLQLVAPTNQRLFVFRWGVFFDSVAAGASVLVKLVRQTSAGTTTSVTLVRLGPIAGSETLQSTAFYNASAEPTTTDTLDIAQGAIDVFRPQGNELIVPGGGRIAILCTANAAVNCVAKFEYNE